jgi:hypothetical protein
MPVVMSMVPQSKSAGSPMITAESMPHTPSALASSMALRPTAFLWQRSVMTRWPPPAMPTRRLVTSGGPGDCRKASVVENENSSHTTLPIEGPL